jgi:GNAT superfamily N-acetyltransferase
MIRLVRTDSDNPDFISLVKELDADLAERDGKEHSFYSQFNKISSIRFVVVGYENEVPVACGAMKEFGTGTMEVKRMYVVPARRGKGFATAILSELEKWAAESGVTKCVLETGKRQPEAIRLYTANGYQQVQNYGQYIGIENSVCFAKEIK